MRTKEFLLRSSNSGLGSSIGQRQILSLARMNRSRVFFNLFISISLFNFYFSYFPPRERNHKKQMLGFLLQRKRDGRGGRARARRCFRVGREYERIGTARLLSFRFTQMDTQWATGGTRKWCCDCVWGVFSCVPGCAFCCNNNVQWTLGLCLSFSCNRSRTQAVILKEYIWISWDKITWAFYRTYPYS